MAIGGSLWQISNFKIEFAKISILAWAYCLFSKMPDFEFET